MHTCFCIHGLFVVKDILVTLGFDSRKRVTDVSLQEIDEYIVQARERSYETMVNFGKQGLSIAATAAVTAAVKVN